MHVLRNLWLGLALLLLAACTPPAPVDSGIHGYVTAGPACPVSRPDVPCPDLPYAAALSILASGDRRPITSVSADASGYYRVMLGAGTYIIRPESPAVMPYAAELVVQVLPHQFTQQDISYDTGIR
jgi:hypothetical protein